MRLMGVIATAAQQLNTSIGFACEAPCEDVQEEGTLDTVDEERHSRLTLRSSFYMSQLQRGCGSCLSCCWCAVCHVESPRVRWSICAALLACHLYSTFRPSGLAESATCHVTRSPFACSFDVQVGCCSSLMCAESHIIKIIEGNF